MQRASRIVTYIPTNQRKTWTCCALDRDDFSCIWYIFAVQCADHKLVRFCIFHNELSMQQMQCNLDKLLACFCTSLALGDNQRRNWLWS